MSAGLCSSVIVPSRHVDLVDHAGRGGDQVDVVFAFQPVADDLKVQQAEEAAAEAEAERGGGFHFVRKAGVVEGELVDGVAQVFEFGGVDGEEAAEHHRLRRFEARQGCLGALLLGRDGVADAGVADLFDRGGEEADFAGAEAVDILHLRAEHAEAVDVVEAPLAIMRMRSPFFIRRR